MSKGRLYGWDEAWEVAKWAKAILSPHCKEIEIAGSVRREKRFVHDVDLVLWPKCRNVETGQVDLFGNCDGKILMPVTLMGLLDEEFKVMLDPARYPRKITIPGLPEEYCEVDSEAIDVELYLCEPDGSNFWALVQMRTGSEEFNISLAARAKRMGLHYRAGYGIFDKEGKRWDDGGTEKGIFDALCIPWIKPQDRTGDYQVFLAAGAAIDGETGAAVG